MDTVIFIVTENLPCTCILGQNFLQSLTFYTICNTTNTVTINNESAVPLANLPAIFSDQCYLTSTLKKHINSGQYITIKCVPHSQKLFSAFRLMCNPSFLIVSQVI